MLPSDARKRYRCPIERQRAQAQQRPDNKNGEPHSESRGRRCSRSHIAPPSSAWLRWCCRHRHHPNPRARYPRRAPSPAWPASSRRRRNHHPRPDKKTPPSRSAGAKAIETHGGGQHCAPRISAQCEDRTIPPIYLWRQARGDPTRAATSWRTPPSRRQGGAFHVPQLGHARARPIGGIEERPNSRKSLSKSPGIVRDLVAQPGRGICGQLLIVHVHVHQRLACRRGNLACARARGRDVAPLVHQVAQRPPEHRCEHHEHLVEPLGHAYQHAAIDAADRQPGSHHWLRAGRTQGSRPCRAGRAPRGRSRYASCNCREQARRLAPRSPPNWRRTAPRAVHRNKSRTAAGRRGCAKW